jgi:hypothetical protein
MSRRRLGACAAHLTAAQTAAQTAPGVTPLPHESLAAFARDGFLVLPLDDLPEGFHDRLYRRTMELQQEGENVWQELPEIYDMFVRSPSVQGALHAIVGPDCVQHPHRALHQGAAALKPDGTVELPEEKTTWPAGSADQAFHKDGNHVAVRDHLPRWTMVMYYPVRTTLHMGPTSVVRGSPYFSVDRGHTFPQSEERLDPGLQPPPTTQDDLQARLKEWKGISGHPEAALLSDGAVDERVAAGVRLLGDPSLSETKLVVEAGSAVFIHFDIFHRATRRIGTRDEIAAAAWRP